MKVYKCKDTKEVVIGYDAYLHTKHWKLKRRHIYKIRNKTCELCKKKINYNESYNVHHKTYDRVGNEKDSDLMLLCPECHKLIHIKKGRIPNILSFVKRYLFNKNDKSQARNRRTTQKWQNNKNGDKSSSKNQEKSRKNYRKQTNQEKVYVAK